MSDNEDDLDRYWTNETNKHKTPKPVDAGAPVAWRVRITNRQGTTMYVYTEKLPYEPFMDEGITIRSEPEPLYLEPAKLDENHITEVLVATRQALEGPLPGVKKTPKIVEQLVDDILQTHQGWAFESPTPLLKKLCDVGYAKCYDSMFQYDYYHLTDAGKAAIRAAVRSGTTDPSAKEFITAALKELEPDVIVLRTSIGKVYTAADMIGEIEKSTEIGKQWGSDLIRVARDLVVRQNKRKEAT